MCFHQTQGISRWEITDLMQLSILKEKTEQEQGFEMPINK